MTQEPCSIRDPDSLFEGVKLALSGSFEPCFVVDSTGRVIWRNSAMVAVCDDVRVDVMADLAEGGNDGMVTAFRKALRGSAPVYTRLVQEPSAPILFVARQLPLAVEKDRRLVLFQGDRSKSLIGRFIAAQSMAEQARKRLRRSIAEQEALRREAVCLRRKALTDPLTGLLNADGFRRQVSESLAREADRQGTLLYLDLDNFKPVNDRFGHAAGDAVLRQTGARMRAELRPFDPVARLGGDEFAVWLSDVTSAEAERIASRLKAALSAPLNVREWAATISDLSAAIGAAESRETDWQFAPLLALADRRMYEDKAQVRRAPCGSGQLRLVGLDAAAGDPSFRAGS